MRNGLSCSPSSEGTGGWALGTGGRGVDMESCDGGRGGCGNSLLPFNILIGRRSGNDRTIRSLPSCQRRKSNCTKELPYLSEVRCSRRVGGEERIEVFRGLISRPGIRRNPFMRFTLSSAASTHLEPPHVVSTTNRTRFRTTFSATSLLFGGLSLRLSLRAALRSVADRDPGLEHRTRRL